MNNYLVVLLNWLKSTETKHSLVGGTSDHVLLIVIKHKISSCQKRNNLYKQAERQGVCMRVHQVTAEKYLILPPAVPLTS